MSEDNKGKDAPKQENPKEDVQKVEVVNSAPQLQGSPSGAIKTDPAQTKADTDPTMKIGDKYVHNQEAIDRKAAQKEAKPDSKYSLYTPTDDATNQPADGVSEIPTEERPGDSLKYTQVEPDPEHPARKLGQMI